MLSVARGVMKLSSLKGESLFAYKRGVYFKTLEIENGGIVCVNLNGFEGERILLALDTLVTPGGVYYA